MKLFEKFQKLSTKGKRLIVIIVVFLLGNIIGGFFGECIKETKGKRFQSHLSRPHCGLYSVINAMGMIGRDVSLEDFADDDFESFDYFTLYDCKRALEKFNVSAYGISVSSPNDLPRKTPMILVLRGSANIPHAVASISIEDRFLLIDGSHITEMDIYELSEVLIGSALVLEKPDSYGALSPIYSNEMKNYVN